MSRKDDIIRTLVTVMKTRGINNDVSMAELARLVDIGKSTIYEYFSSKDELVKDAVLTMINDYVDEALTINDLATYSFEDQFKMQFSKLLTITNESKIITEALMRDIIPMLPVSIRDEIKAEMLNIKSRLERQFAQIFAKGFEEGIISRELTEARSIVISGLVMGGLIRYTNAENNVAQEDFVNEMYESMLQLL